MKAALYICPFRFLPTPAPPSEDEGEKNEDDGDNLDSEGDNEEVEPEEEVHPDGGEGAAPVEGDDEPGMWEETFKSHSDSKPYGGYLNCIVGIFSRVKISLLSPIALVGGILIFLSQWGYFKNTLIYVLLSGPSSIGMDISFPGVNHVYGIPEHADSLALKPTV